MHVHVSLCCTCVVQLSYLGPVFDHFNSMPNKSTVKSKTGRWEWPGNEAILVYSIWCTPSLRWGSPTVTQDSEEKQVEELRYTVKVINAGTSSGCVIKKWDTNTRFSNVSDLKDQLASDFATLLQDGADFLFGYIQRGHGMRANNFPSQKMMTFEICMMTTKEGGR